MVVMENMCIGEIQRDQLEMILRFKTIPKNIENSLQPRMKFYVC